MQTVVHWLAENGADCNIANNDGSTAMCHAAFFGFIDVIRILAKYNADINRADNEGYTPLLFAAREGQLAVFDC